MLIIFKGYPGTGKTYLAERLSIELNMPLIVRDKIKTKFLKKVPKNSLGRKSYEIMWQMARKYISTYGNCICDTSLIQPDGINEINQISRDFQTKILIIECFCSDKEIQYTRIDKRVNYPKYYSINNRTDLEDFIKKNKKYQNINFPFETIKVDTSKNYSMDELLKSINSYRNNN